MDAEIVTKIVGALDFAAVKHRDQRRKDPQQTPYINHPIGVAKILVFEGRVTDPDTVQAALLHDTVEDTDTTLQEITDTFGEKVASIVGEVSDDKSLPSAERKRLQVLHAPTCSHSAKLVKLADKLYNIRDMLRVTPVGWTDQRIQEYLLWSSQVLDGLRGTNSVLEQEIERLITSNVRDQDRLRKPKL